MLNLWDGVNYANADIGRGNLRDQVITDYRETRDLQRLDEGERYLAGKYRRTSFWTSKPSWLWRTCRINFWLDCPTFVMRAYCGQPVTMSCVSMPI